MAEVCANCMGPTPCDCFERKQSQDREAPAFSPELILMAEFAAKLDALDPDAQKRVLRWLMDRAYPLPDVVDTEG